MARAAANLNICDYGVSARIQWLLQSFGLPVFTGSSAGDLATMALSDKKRSGAAVNLIVPVEIGNCVIRPTPVEEIESFIQAGL